MSSELPPSRTAEQFVVRFPEGMRNRVAEAAKANSRSMNAEIVARLQASFEPATDDSLKQKVEQANAELDALIELRIQKIDAAAKRIADREHQRIIALLDGMKIKHAPGKTPK